MRTPRATAACLITAWLTACQQAPDAPAPRDVRAFPATQAGSAADTSVPSASSVMLPAEAKPAEPASAGRSNAAMSRSQESTAMPMPGQNNDHSAPLSANQPSASGARGPRNGAP